MNFVLPSKSDVGYLDPEIAGEGQRVILSDGDVVSYNPPPPKPVMPDWSQIKSIRHYFGRTGHQVWPAWLYHPTEEPRLVRNSKEADELGVCYREATLDEKGRYGLKTVWDWKGDSQWRPQPYPGSLKFNPFKPGQGKTYIPDAPNARIAHNELLETLIPAVAAAVAKSLNVNGPKAPASIDPKQWEDFLAFQAWQKSNEVIDDISHGESVNALNTPENSVSNKLSSEQEREVWEKEAEDRGIKVDGRWSIDRLKSEVEKASKAA